MARIARKPTVKKRSSKPDDADRAVGIEPARPYEAEEEASPDADEPKPPRNGKALEAQFDDDEDAAEDMDDGVASLHLARLHSDEE